MQPTQDRKSDHLVPYILSGRNRAPLWRRSVAQSLDAAVPARRRPHTRFRTRLVLPLMQDQQVIEAFLPHTPGRSAHRWHWLEARERAF
jgi:hypothetical protein